ncbi:calcium-activated chloride channel-domain-containing protein [Gorgonomyces haynaldii]|nr:calcium-activated chloride channel-domain-containing protein [Gorgonomyces haynaldii]
MESQKAFQLDPFYWQKDEASKMIDGLLAPSQNIQKQPSREQFAQVTERTFNDVAINVQGLESPTFQPLKSRRRQKAIDLKEDPAIQQWQKLGITIRYLDSRIVLLLFDKDIKLFDEMLQSRLDRNQAQLTFGPRSYSDALMQILFNTMPCDMIIKFTSENQDKIDIRYCEARNLFILELLKHNFFLEIEAVEQHFSRYIKIRTPFELLCREAEKREMKMALSRSYLAKLLPKYNDNFVGNSPRFWESPFHMMEQVWFDPREKRSGVFSMASLSDFEGGDMNALGEGLVKDRFFSNAKRIHLTHSIITHIGIQIEKDGALLFIDRLVDNLVFQDYFAPHDGQHLPENNINARSQLYEQWREKLTIRGLLVKFPIKDIRAYFGEQDGYYFVWCLFFARWCLPMALMGVIVFLVGLVLAFLQEDMSIIDRLFVLLDNPATLVYGFIVNCWSILFIIFWKRQSETLAHEWDTANLHKKERIRSEWIPNSTRKSPITGEDEYHLDNKMRKQWISAGWMMLAFGVFVAIISAEVIVRDQISKLLDKVDPKQLNLQKAFLPQQTIPVVVTGLFSVAQILILQPVYLFLARKLNDWENHKFFMFSFVNYYALLVCTGLVFPVMNALGSPVFPSKDTRPGFNQKASRDTIINVFITITVLQLVTTLTSILWPWIKTKFRQKITNRFDDLKQKPPYYILESDLQPYLFIDLAQDYTSKIITLGFLFIFSSTFCLAPLIVYLALLMEMKLDLWRRLRIYRRGFCPPANSISGWEPLMELLANLGVLSTSILIAFNSNAFDVHVVSPMTNYSGDLKQELNIRLGFVLLYQQLLYLIQYLFRRFIPWLSKHVLVGKQAEEHIALLRQGEFSDFTVLKSPKRKSMWDSFTFKQS